MDRLGTRLGLATGILALTLAGVALGRGDIINCTGGPCVGTSTGELLIGTSDPDQIRALGGNDELVGRQDDDALRGGAGRDETAGDAGDDLHVGGAGSDNLSEFSGDTEGGEDSMKGGKGRDFMEGNTGGDTLLGGKGNDSQRQKTAPPRQLRGESCLRGLCPTMFGDTGPDLLNGGKGDDALQGEQGRDEMLGGPGDDVIDALNDDEGDRDKVSCGGGRDLALAGPEDKVADDCEKVRDSAPGGPLRAARGTSIDCTSGGPCTGTPAGEFMQGGDLADQISSLGGDDGIEGEGAVDLLKGGSGEDVLEGGEKGDTMKGGSGDDAFFGPVRARGVVVPGPTRTGPGFYGDEGPDDIFGGGGNDHLEGEEGNDEMLGGAGKDYLDAINDDTNGTRDKLNCGKGFDRYSARAGDVVADNCEKKVPGSLPI